MKKVIQLFLKKFGYRLQSLRDSIMDADPLFNEIYAKAKPFTFTTRERCFSLYEATKYIVRSGIEGDFVECGVWMGGSVMIIASTLKALGAERKIWMYDTFEGMAGKSAEDHQVCNPNESGGDPSIGPLEDVLKNVASTGYDLKNVISVKGKVEDTIPGTMPKKIALLRLDTDWYLSTKQELDHLYPILGKGGICIIDDYGAWAGAKKAVDEYFNGKVLLNRIDHDSRLIQR